MPSFFVNQEKNNFFEEILRIYDFFANYIYRGGLKIMARIEKINQKETEELFMLIFANEKRKDLTLSLFNVLNETDYKDTDDIIVKDIEGTLFVITKDGCGFMLVDAVNVWNKDLFLNPNIPLKFVLYTRKIYEEYLHEHHFNWFSTRKVYFPRPRYFCFYNGIENRNATEILKLSDSYESNEPAQIEAKVHLFNLEKKQEKLEKCKALIDYGRFISKLNKNKEKYSDIKLLVDKTLEDMTDDFMLHEIFNQDKDRVVEILQEEYSD